MVDVNSSATFLSKGTSQSLPDSDVDPEVPLHELDSLLRLKHNIKVLCENK